MLWRVLGRSELRTIREPVPPIHLCHVRRDGAVGSRHAFYIYGLNMRWADLCVGESYRLNTGTKLMLLETPPELRSRARARVRFETGIKRGEVADLACQRIVEPWDGPLPQRAAAKLRPQPEYVMQERAARRGDTVTRGETAGVIWTVTAVDDRAGTATITGELLSRAQTHVVPKDQVTVVHRSTPPKRRLPPKPPSPINGDERPAPAEPDRPLQPDRPRRKLDELLDALIFSPTCLDEYRRRCAPKTARAELADGLREEIRRKGYVVSGWTPEYARLRVERRFDVVIPKMTGEEDVIRIERLHYPHRSVTRRRGR